MKRNSTTATVLAAITVAAGLASAPAMAETPRETFTSICEMSGGSASRDWGSGRLVCRFPDGSVIWCTPTMQRCGLRKAAVRADETDEPRQPSLPRFVRALTPNPAPAR
jgi:hypothetical protein